MKALAIFFKKPVHKSDINRIFYILLIILFINGLENILLPPLDYNHNWRQTLTIGTAKEFVSHPNILYPRTIIGGETEIYGSEFPFYGYLISILIKIFGFQHWYGRLLNWCCFFIAMHLFYKILRALFNHKIAFFTCLFMLSALPCVYARASMPDVFALSLSLYGIYFIYRYFVSKKNLLLIIGCLLLILSWMVKLPYILLTLFIILLIDQLRPDKKQIIKLGSILIIGLIFPVAWYFYWVPFLISKYHNQLIWSFSLSEGFAEFSKLFDHFLYHLVKKTFYNIPLFFISFLGLGYYFFKGSNKDKVFILLFIIGFLIFAIKSGNTIPTHDYYFIPVTLLLCLGLGVGWEKLNINFYALLLLCLVLMWPGIKYQKSNSFNDPSLKYYQELSGIVKAIIPENEKILVNGGDFNPFMMYWTNRTGWTWNQENFQKTDWLVDVHQKKGLNYIIQNKKEQDIRHPFDIIFENENWRIQKIK